MTRRPPRSGTTNHVAEGSPSPERERVGVRAGVPPNPRQTTCMIFLGQNRDQFNSLAGGCPSSLVFVGFHPNPPCHGPSDRHFLGAESRECNSLG